MSTKKLTNSVFLKPREETSCGESTAADPDSEALDEDIFLMFLPRPHGYKSIDVTYLSIYISITRLLFMIQCKNHVFGCSFTSASMAGLTVHETKCQLTSFDALKPAKSFTCPKCSKGHTTEEGMDRHFKRA